MNELPATRVLDGEPVHAPGEGVGRGWGGEERSGSRMPGRPERVAARAEGFGQPGCPGASNTRKLITLSMAPIRSVIDGVGGCSISIRL